MDSLEANFPHWFPKEPDQQKALPIFKQYGDRGFARDEVIDSGNQIQCDQAYLDGLLREQAAIKTLILQNQRAFGLCELEAFNEDTQPSVLQAFEDLKNLNEDVKRLKSHPELFSDDQTRAKFLQQSSRIAKETRKILNGHVDDIFKAVRVSMQKSAAPVKPAVSTVAPQPWQTWCGLLSLPTAAQPQTLKDFTAKHPDMVLIGVQVVPHMGVLIAEHWRLQVEPIIEKIAEKYSDITDCFPKVEKMLSGIRGEPKGRFAVMRFVVNQPNAAKTGHMFAFGPQDKVADLARFLARCKNIQDITRLGLPRAVMMGTFVDRDEAKKFPHLRKFV